MRKLLPLFYIFLASQTFAGVYGDLEFGDDRKTVTKKLHASELVTAKTTDSIFGNIGLNGVFKCNQELAGLALSLSFNWKDEKLSGVGIYSEHFEKKQYNTSIQDAWKDAIQLLDSTYGPAASTNTYPSQSKRGQNGLVFSHFWNIDENTVAALGTGKADDKYFLAIQYLQPSALQKVDN